MIVDQSTTPDSVVTAAPRPFDDLQVGDVLEPPARRITLEDLEAFAARTETRGDEVFSAVWVKKADAATSPAMDVQDLGFAGSDLLANVIGEAFVAASLASPSARDLQAGDTIHTRLVIRNLTRLRATGVVTAAVTIRNQNGQPIVEGEHTYLLRVERDT